MRETVFIDFKQHQVYEAGALLLTHLALPEEEISEEKRGGLHATLCSLALQRLHKDGASYIAPQTIKPVYAFRDEKQIARDWRTFPRRLRDRDVAGRMAIAFLKEVVIKNTEYLPKSIRRLSLNEISMMVLEDSGQSDPENVESRIWRPSLPVIHIAAAIQVVMQNLAREGLPVFNFWDLLQEQFIIEHVVLLAQEYESLLAMSKLKINPQDLIKLRIIH